MTVFDLSGPFGPVIAFAIIIAFSFVSGFLMLMTEPSYRRTAARDSAIFTGYWIAYMAGLTVLTGALFLVLHVLGVIVRAVP
jgi:hypothetical protein